MSRLDAFSATRSSLLACMISNQLSALLCDAGVVCEFSLQWWFFRSVGLLSSVHPRHRAGFLIHSYYCLLYALLICSVSLARKFRAAAVPAFSALRTLSFELLRVRERASTHPTRCPRTFRSTVRPGEEREVRTSTYARERDKRPLNATSSTKSKKVSFGLFQCAEVNVNVIFLLFTATTATTRTTSILLPKTK